MRKPRLSLYAGADPRELPSYTLRDAAHYSGVPLATLKTWVWGRDYPTAGGLKQFKPIIQPPDPSKPSLSFFNLVEAHVLAAIRRHHKVPLRKVRSALNFLKQRYPSPHPLADQHFQTDGINLFIEKFGKLISISQEGQIAMRDLLQEHLKRIEHDENGQASRLYPFIRPGSLDQPKAVVIDPFVSFGRPVLFGTGIPTAVVAECYKAGDSIDELAHEYGRQRHEIEEAIRCELWLQAA